jgi:ElaB/YqjD/DUF883 family membrane-anchored ribosome-binding protein
MELSEVPRITEEIEWAFRSREDKEPSMNSHSDLSRKTSSGNQNPGTYPGVSQETAKTADQAAVDLQTLRDDFANLKDTVAKLASQAGSDAAKAARTASAGVTSQVSDAASNLAEKGSELASAATAQAKTFASELETMARKNPLGAMAGAVMVGVLVGLIGRGRG